MLAGSGLAGAYFNNANLSGSPVATRIDKTVNFAWSGSPGVSGVGADNFSVRWTGQVSPKYTGLYTFLTRSDDGVRLFVNGQRIIDNWTRHAETLNTGTVTLTAGQKANVTMEFFESQKQVTGGCEKLIKATYGSLSDEQIEGIKADSVDVTGGKANVQLANGDSLVLKKDGDEWKVTLD